MAKSHQIVCGPQISDLHVLRRLRKIHRFTFSRFRAGYASEPFGSAPEIAAQFGATMMIKLMSDLSASIERQFVAGFALGSIEPEEIIALGSAGDPMQRRTFGVRYHLFPHDDYSFTRLPAARFASCSEKFKFFKTVGSSRPGSRQNDQEQLRFIDRVRDSRIETFRFFDLFLVPPNPRHRVSLLLDRVTKMHMERGYKTLLVIDPGCRLVVSRAYDRKI